MKARLLLQELAVSPGALCMLQRLNGAYERGCKASFRPRLHVLKVPAGAGNLTW